MPPTPKPFTIQRGVTTLLRVFIGAGILFVGWLILAPYRHYLPADFSRGFLRNKAEYFYRSSYFLGFYAHIVSAPLALLCGTLQMSGTLRRQWPQWHQRLGGMYSVLVLGLAAPGGLVMALRAYGGVASVVCFGLISVLAWGFTWQGWQAARSHRYAAHGRWMMRSYLLICSAVALRLVHYGLQPLEMEAVTTYRLAAWLSWLPGLVLLEAWFRWRP